MAEFSNVATQTVAVNGNVLFTDTPTSVCNKGYITHRTGSGLINLKGATNTCKAKYRVEFNGNIAVRYRYFVYKSGNCAFQIWSFACVHLPAIAFDIFSDCSL